MNAFLRALPIEGKVRRRELVEKDQYIHRILSYLQENSPLGEDLYFKGGTCLTKAHLGYFRFSEDIDFTWAHQDDWDGLSTAQVKKRCSSLIDDIAVELEVLTADLGFNFLADKVEPDQIDIGSGGRMVTFNIWYFSVVTGAEEFLKVQLNFVDDIFDDVEELPLTSFVSEILGDEELEELRFRFDEDIRDYTREFAFPCYSSREIYLEKCRAILTRRGIKVRDVIDIGMLEARFGYTVEQQASDIVKKTVPMLNYQRYAKNLEGRTPSLPKEYPDREMSMMIGPLPSSVLDRLPDIYSEIYSLSRNLI